VTTHGVAAAGADIFVVMHNAGDRMLFQRTDRTDGDTVRINTVHTLFLDVGITVFFLIFVFTAAARPYLDNVIGVR